MSGGPKALIVTVNFRHSGCTLQLLSSASRLAGFGDCHLMIVDNNSGDESTDRIGQAISGLKNVELLEASENLGYFGAARWALDEYLARHTAPDWVVVCNNDVVFVDTLFLQKLAERNPAADGVIGASIISNLTGYDANPSIGKRPNRFQMWHYGLWLSSYHAMWFKQWLSPFVRRLRHKIRKRTPSRATAIRRPIYAPHGSFLIFSRRFFDTGGFIDDHFFLYAEEFSVAEMCRRFGLPVIHDPELKVWHQEGQSTGRMLSRNIYLHQRAGFEYALARYKDGYRGILHPADANKIVARDMNDLMRVPAIGEDLR